MHIVRILFILLLSITGWKPLIAQDVQTVSPHGNLTIDIECSSCHTANSWVPAKSNMDFDHSSQTNFPLLGKHTLTDCESCHLELNFTEPSIFGDGCESCHVDVHQGMFSETCTECHNQESFTDVDGQFIHNMTLFPLTGAHQQIECQSCHVDQSQGHFTSLDTDCIDCHEQDYKEAKTVDHVESGFPETCDDCHTTLAWQPAFFDHETASDGFALLGAHQLVDCASCHIFPSKDLIFTPESNEDCYACHADDYQSEHGGSGFPTECIACHNVNTWHDADFEHEIASGGFALLGAHSKIDCNDCHTSNYDLIFTPPPANQEDCYTCHVRDYQEEHAGSGFPTDCTICHDVNDWDDAEFEHTKASGGFELLGAHNQTECSSCHAPDVTLLFNPAPNGQEDCYTCHVQDYETEHGGTGYPTDCTECHNVNSWDDAEFEHSTVSGGFQLLGAHSTANCQTCHTPDFGLVFNPAPTTQDDCYTCHAQDYEEEHAGTGFPTDCTECHNVNSWEGATFDHGAISGGFALLGAHSTATCESCHTPDYGLVFNPAPSTQDDCYTCHAQEYEEEHAGTGFPTDCTECHNVNSWEGATFDHGAISGGFALLGAHSTATCESCHTPDFGLVFNPAPSTQDDCYTCHAQEYEEEHAGTGFPTDCTTCHNLDSWDGAKFEDHDNLYFPIFSGSHRGEWNNDCSSCHVIPSDFSQFECINCHEHRQSKMDDEHSDVRNYVFQSTACYSCHPDGREDDD